MVHRISGQPKQGTAIHAVLLRQALNARLTPSNNYIEGKENTYSINRRLEITHDRMTHTQSQSTFINNSVRMGYIPALPVHTQSQ